MLKLHKKEVVKGRKSIRKVGEQPREVQLFCTLFDLKMTSYYDLKKKSLASEPPEKSSICRFKQLKTNKFYLLSGWLSDVDKFNQFVLESNLAKKPLDEAIILFNLSRED